MLTDSGPAGTTRRRSLFALAALAFQPVRAASPHGVIRVLLDDWPPYINPRKGPPIRGLDAELLQAICTQANYEVAWINAPVSWRKRRYMELLNDQFDLIFSATPRSTNMDVVMYTQRYRDEVMMVCAPRSHAAELDQIRSFQDVLDRKIRLLHIDAKGLGKEFEEFRPRLEAAGLLVRFPTSIHGLEMLRAGRGQFVLGDALSLQYQSKIAGMDLVRMPFGYSTQPVSLLLSRRRLGEDDLQRLDKAIEQLERKGVLGAIRKTYLPA